MHRLEGSKGDRVWGARAAGAGSVARLPRLGVAQVRSPQQRHMGAPNARYKRGRQQSDPIPGSPDDHSWQARLGDLRKD
jgi:hypothetical protein